MKTMEIASRIKKAREKMEYSYADLAKLTNMSKSTLQRYETGAIQDIPISKLKDIAAALEMSEQELLGLHPPQLASSWGDPILEAYAAKPRPTQENVCKLLDIAHVVPGEVPEEDEEPDPFSLSLQKAAAGRGVYLGPEEFTTIYVKSGHLPQNAAFGVPVDGDSMEPKFHDGDILIVSKEKAQNHQIGVFTMDGMGYVKRLRGKYLVSINPKYDDIAMTPGTICNGAVIGVLDKSSIVEE